MKNPRNNELLQTLVGKKISKVYVSDSHGESLKLTFTDGTVCYICSAYGLLDKSVKEDPNDIYVNIDDEAV